MPPTIDFLFTLAPGRELATLQAVIEAVDTLIGDQNESISSLVGLLEDSSFVNRLYEQHDSHLVSKILASITQMLTSEDSIHNLILRLDIRHERDLAAIYLGWFGSRASQALPELIDLASGNSGTVGPAKQAIRRIGNAEALLISALRKSILADDDGEFREVCGLIITMNYASAPVFRDLLYQAVQSTNDDMKIAVADAISKLKPSAKKQFSTLVERLMLDVNPEVLRAAREAT
jgi:hypothetical protein